MEVEILGWNKNGALPSQLTDPQNDPNEHFDEPSQRQPPSIFSTTTYSPTDSISRLEYRHFHTALSEHLSASEA